MNENKCKICGEAIPEGWTLCTPCQRREIKIGMIMQSYGDEKEENKIDCGGSCTVDGDVSGNIDAGGSITCGNVSGDLDAGGSVRCKR